MTVKQLRLVLESYPEGVTPRFILPDGNQIPAHLHVTEVGHVTKKFIDCGGVVGKSETCVLQIWLGHDVDHHLTAGQLAKILTLGGRVLPTQNLNVEVEYDCCVVGQYPIEHVKRTRKYLDIRLANKRTQCLARERRKAKTEASCCGTAPRC